MQAAIKGVAAEEEHASFKSQSLTRTRNRDAPYQRPREVCRVLAAVTQLIYVHIHVCILKHEIALTHIRVFLNSYTSFS